MNTTVLIPTHGRPTLLERTLESLSQCRLPDSYTELVVIENGSRAGAEELVEALPERLKARYMHHSRGNKSYALNQALETIADGLVVFFDDDVKVHPDTLIEYAEAASNHPNGGEYFGGTVEVEREVEPPSWLEPSLPDSACGYVADGSREGKFYLGFNWAAFRKDIQKVGGFDIQLGPGSKGGGMGDETDLQERMRNAEITPVDVSGAVVTHYVPRECCRVQWALRRRYKAGVSGYYMDGRSVMKLKEALKITFWGGLLMLKSILVWRPESVIFGALRISAAVGIVSAYCQDGIPLKAKK